MWVMWNLIPVRLETGLVSVQDRCMVCAKGTIGSENWFGHTRWYSEVRRLKWKLNSVRLEIVPVLMQDRCTVWAKRTTGSKIILDAWDGIPRGHESCGISFQSVWR
jgi:hypothetical protein